MFCSAIEKPKVAAEMPRSTVIGRMNSPRIWRRPMHIEMMTPLRTMRSSIARRFSRVVTGVQCGKQVGLPMIRYCVYCCQTIFLHRSVSTATHAERILAAADKLFYRQGIRAVGADAVAAEAGVSKRTLYNHYPSKDALIAAYLTARFKQIAPSDAPAREQILGTFDRLERIFQATGFRGCPFVNAVAEIGDPKH